jgi:hypothetical protein
VHERVAGCLWNPVGGSTLGGFLAFEKENRTTTLALTNHHVAVEEGYPIERGTSKSLLSDNSVDTCCQPGTSVHGVYVNFISHVTLCHLLTHLGCVYNRSM